MTSRNVTLREHTLDKLASCISVLVMGKRRTGKSTLGALLVRKLAQSGIGRFVIFCGNRESIVDWQRLIHPLYVHGKDMEALEAIVHFQDERVGTDRARFNDRERELKLADPYYEPREYVVPLHLQLCVVLDDLGSERGVMHHKVIKDIQSNGRHYGMSVIFLLQYYTQLPPENRDQADYVFMLQTTNTKSVDKVFSEYISSTCCTRQSFAYMLAACTNKKGRCMCIDNCNSSWSLESRIFFTRIPWPVEPQPIGDRQFIKYGKEHYISSQRWLQKLDEPTTSSVLSRRLDDDYEEPEYNHSVVSLNRRRNLNLAVLKENQESFRDQRGHLFQINLKNSKGNKDD